MNGDDQQNMLLSNEMSQHKKHKKRTKNLLLQLKDQIEFYFSDANLQKDRFLNQEINKHPERYVAVSIIASFNRMKQKTSDLSLVLKAMKMSTLLEVSEDGTMVKRRTPVPEPRNVDKETVYVEKLPPYADHDWIKEIFSKCGKVLYVSIPRFKHTGEVKGFAFVEFETSKQAKEAIQMFNKGSTSKQSYGGGENGSSTDVLNEQHKTKGKRKRSQSESDVEMQKHRERKRKRTTSESSVDSSEADHCVSMSSSFDLKQAGKERTLLEKNKEDDQPKGKETETFGSSGEQYCRSRKGKKSVRWDGKEESTLKGNKTVKSDVSSTTGVKRPRVLSDCEYDNEDDEGKAGKLKQLKLVIDSEYRVAVHDNDSKEAEASEGSKKQKKRKRKKKERKETRLPHLRVISKLDWLKLKNEYKNLQRQAMKNLKQQLQEKSSNDSNRLEQRKHKQPEKTDSENAGKETYEKKSDKGLIELSYTPGVVLKFQCQRHGTKKELREKFSSCAPVAYLELAEDNVQGYVRFYTAENCTAVWKEMSSANCEIKLVRLTEEEEKSYWKKINTDRKARFNSKRENKRGTDKVARKAEALQVKLQSHVRFHDGESEEET